MNVRYRHGVVEVRPARSGDAGTAAKLARAAYLPYVPRVGRPPAPMDEDYPAVVAGGRMWVAEDAGRIVGFVVLTDAADHLLLDNLAVSPDAQGRGVGAALLGLAEREAVRRGHGEVRLYTNEAMTDNLGYYPRHGYVETHRAEQDGFRRVFFRKALSA